MIKMEQKRRIKGGNGRDTKKVKGKTVIDIAIAVVILASLFAATMPMVSAKSTGGNFNIIGAWKTEKVLVGQNLEFEGFTGTVRVSRIISGDVENVYLADANNRIYNVNWPTSGAFYVNYQAADQAQLSVEKPAMPLSLKVGTRKVAFIAVGTPLALDIGGMNLYPEDRVNLVVIGPDGQIKHDEVNNQQFTDIAVNYLRSHYGGWDHTLDTSGWGLGAYTFMIRTKPEYACGLEAESAVNALKIKKVKSISLPRDPFVPSFRQ